MYQHHITRSSSLAEIGVKGLGSRRNHRLNDCYARNVDEVLKALSKGKDLDKVEQVYKEHHAKIDKATVTAEVKQVILYIKRASPDAKMTRKQTIEKTLPRKR
jgi:hypothetical protein